MKSATVLRFSGLILSILPPAAAAVCYFPLFRESPVRLLSGIALLLLLLSALPLFRFFKKKKISPGIAGVWIFVFLLFYFFGQIASEVTVVAFFGALGNAAGTLLFHIADKKKEGTEAHE